MIPGVCIGLFIAGVWLAATGDETAAAWLLLAAFALALVELFQGEM